jgi:hypothetical protein
MKAGLLSRINSAVFMMVALTVSLMASAQEGGADTPQPAQSNVVKSKDTKKQTLNFEDELVEGQTQKPELFYLFQKKNFNYKRLIRLRENFLPEMRKTSEDIQRVRGAN